MFENSILSVAFPFKPYFEMGAFPSISGDLPAYSGLLPFEDIIEIQRLIGHQFKCLGILERAAIHPSFPGCPFGSNDFQKLEFLGDAALDFYIVQKVFRDARCDNPLKMHGSKISYVNNSSLGRIVIDSGISGHVHTHFAKEARSDEKISKLYSDIFEALVGAIVCDVDCDYAAFERIMDGELWALIKKYRNPENSVEAEDIFLE